MEGEVVKSGEQVGQVVVLVAENEGVRWKERRFV